MAKYRPQLDEVDAEFRRRLGSLGNVRTLAGAMQSPRYTSAELDEYAYRRAIARQSGRTMPNVSILPLNKNDEYWLINPLRRHAYFYPHDDATSGEPVKARAVSAEAGISTVFHRLHHNPDGYQRAKEYEFVTCFECEDAHLSVVDQIRRALRDEQQNPEWRYVIEGPE